jgi:hypothetical protein
MYDEKTAERIRRRAYELWLAEQQQHGRDQAHWLQAEREVLAEGKPAGGRKTTASKTGGMKKTGTGSPAKKTATRKKTASQKTAKKVNRKK